MFSFLQRSKLKVLSLIIFQIVPKMFPKSYLFIVACFHIYHLGQRTNLTVYCHNICMY